MAPINSPIPFNFSERLVENSVESSEKYRRFFCRAHSCWIHNFNRKRNKQPLQKNTCPNKPIIQKLTPPWTPSNSFSSASCRSSALRRSLPPTATAIGRARNRGVVICEQWKAAAESWPRAPSPTRDVAGSSPSPAPGTTHPTPASSALARVSSFAVPSRINRCKRRNQSSSWCCWCSFVPRKATGGHNHSLTMIHSSGSERFFCLSAPNRLAWVL